MANSSSSQGRSGRPAKIPEGFQACMDEFIKDSRSWLNRYSEVWFSSKNPVLENAYGVLEHKDAPASYDEAIELIDAIAACAAEGKEKLVKGKATAERKLAGKKPEQAASVVEASTSSDDEGEGDEGDDDCEDDEDDDNKGSGDAKGEMKKYFGDSL